MLLVLAACKAELSAGVATEVIVEIDAEPSVRALTRSLRVHVAASDGLNGLEQRLTRLEETVSPVELPKRVALVPLKGAAEGRIFVLTATALDAQGALVGEARIVSGYMKNQVRYARLVIEDACLLKSCEDSLSSCSRGACATATIDVSSFSRDEQAPTTVRFGEGAPDAGSDAGVTMEPIDAGGMPAEAGEDAETDAAPLVAAVFTLGGSCTRAGALGCSDYDSAVSVVCSAGVWRESLRCSTSQRCDTRLGADQGQCLELVAECTDAQPGAAFCRGNQRMTCGADRVSAEGVSCPAGQVCVRMGTQTACMPDPDECAMQTDDCDDQPEACRNMLGGFTCVCPPGYSGQGKGASGCSDINECASGAASACGAGASACTNTNGSYRCTCQAGFNGTGGRACTDVDECANGAVAACGAGATACTNSSGGFSCTCGSGYVGSGTRACVPGAAPGTVCERTSDCRSCTGAAVSCNGSLCECGDGAPCSANVQCQGTCAGGHCVATDTSCDALDDCRGMNVCHLPSGGNVGVCRLPEGSSCSANGECAVTCRPPDPEENSVNRFCQALGAQDAHCDENSDCRPELRCRPYAGTGPHCELPGRMLELCDENVDCMSPLSCVQLAPGNVVCQ